MSKAGAKGESYEMDEDVAVTEPLKPSDSSSPSKVKFTAQPEGKNGDAKLDIKNGYGGSVGMSKEELMKYANDPFWVRLRLFLFILFWVVWFAMLIGSVVIIAIAPKCPATSSLPWWQKTTIYQIYIRSFKDSNGDGQGDLRGIIEKLDYLKDTLGVETLLISPFFVTEMRDVGYDIVNYKDVDTRFGTMDDFEELVSKMHADKMKVLIDFVPNHSSDKHPWFIESVKRNPKYEDYYVWRDAKNDSLSGKREPPNNWRSVFGGSAWEWNDERKQFYLHQFLPRQPDLNLRNEEVRRELKEVLQFWMKKKVDGIRIDAASHLYEDENFEDEPPNPKFPESGKELAYDNVIHNKTKTQPENYQIMRDWRKVVKQAGLDKILIAEAYEPLDDLVKYYGTQTDPIVDMPFNFQLLDLDVSVSNASLKKIYDDWQEATGKLNWTQDAKPPGPWTAWVTGNHDKGRLAGRVGQALVDVIHMITFMLPRSTPVIYYGDEIGITNTNDIPEYTLNEGDSTRLPYRALMQWTPDSPSAGFSNNETAKTWISPSKGYTQFNVKVEMEVNTTSHLKTFQKLVQLRKGQAESIVLGQTVFPKTNTNNSNSEVFTFARWYKGNNGYLLAANFGGVKSLVTLNEEYLPATGKVNITSSESGSSSPEESTEIEFKGFELGERSAIIIEFTPNEKEE